MKKAKKMLLAASALALVSFGFSGCTAEDDDENDMISNKGEVYSINYTNNDARDTSRGYKTYGVSRRNGALVEFKFTDTNVSERSKAGVLGFIWELDDTAGKRSFFVLGLRQESGVPYYYISKFSDVTDIGAYNFGAPVDDYAGNGAKEEVVASFTSLGSGFKTEKEVTVYADIKPRVNGYDVAIYKTRANAEAKTNAVVTKPIDSPNEGKEPAIKTLAFYANVYQLKTLSGTWEILNKYGEAEVTEVE